MNQTLQKYESLVFKLASSEENCKPTEALKEWHSQLTAHYLVSHMIILNRWITILLWNETLLSFHFHAFSVPLLSKRSVPFTLMQLIISMAF